MRESVPSWLRVAIACGSAVALAAPANAQGGPTQLRVEIDPASRVQTPQSPGVLVPNPGVTIRRESNLDPTLVGQTTPPAVGGPLRPTLPRAVAPPVGDISVSTLDASAARINLNTTARVPRLVLRDAPVREVLTLLARSANLNVVFAEGVTGENVVETISIDLENELVQEVFTAVLQISGLRASRSGSIIYVGATLPQATQNLISRTYRLNEVPATNAATFLATQGASTQQIFEEVEQIVNPETGEIIREIPQPPRIITVDLSEEERGVAPVLLDGLSVSTDDRLNSITLVGAPRLVEIATTLIKQLDARRRQVAINVKIVDVNLLNNEEYSASVSFGVGDGFFVSDNGAAAVNFGGTNPPTRAQSTTPGAVTPPIIPLPGVSGSPFLDDLSGAPFGGSTQIRDAQGNVIAQGFSRAPFGTSTNPFQPGITEIDEDGEITFELPSLFQTPSDFLATLQAQVTSGNAKILTDPTLVVQESEIAGVNLTQEIFSGVIRGENGAEEPNIREAGLVLDIAVARIDDNGFVSLTVQPSVTAPSGVVNTGLAGQGTVQLLSTRSLNSGLIRLRDGQTLILSGIIQETDTVAVSKVPFLGDLPIIGALFRGSSRTNQRQEIVVMLTPRILDESLAGGGFGFDANFSPETRQLLQQQSFPVPGNSQ